MHMRRYRQLTQEERYQITAQIAGSLGEAGYPLVSHEWIYRHQACLRPRDRFCDIPVPKIDSAFDNLFVLQPSWSPSTTQQLRKLVAAPYLSPNDWTPRLDAYFASPLALCARRVAVRPRGYWGLPAFASLSIAGSEGIF